MYIQLKPVFHQGVELPAKVRKDLPPVTGVLHLHEERIARIGRTVRVARVKDPSDATIQSKVSQLFDAVVEYCVDNRMRIRGVEEENGTLYGQCWDVTVVKV